MENKQEFEVESLGIRYALEETSEGKKIVLSEEDFEKVFSKLRELQVLVNDLQGQVIEDLKRQALIKNILST